LRRRITIFVAVIQSILFAGHWLVYETVAAFLITDTPRGPLGISALAWTFLLLSVSSVAASLLAWRYTNPLMRAFYSAAAIWLAFFNFLFFAACACWAIYGISRVFRWQIDGRLLAAISFAAALAAGIYGIANAAWLRVKRVSVQLPGLPESWRGRVAALVSDTHLGHVRGVGFIRRIVALLNRAKPDIVFLAGDVFDGTAVNAEKVVSPFRGIAAPLGTYFVTGNHEEFRDSSPYIAAIAKAGVRVLKNEKVTVDGLQIVGVFYHESTWEPRLQEILQAASIDRARASILISHEPRHLAVAEREGISLQVSGHTHGGQMIPWTRFASRIFGRFVHGLQRFEQMLVYTSYGAGTWGPPARVGTYAEIVLIEFE
jgi:predicted MPP superfamily phosphohydrolase